MTEGDTQSIVRVESLTKIYHPSPRWLAFLLRSAVDSPVTALDGVSFQVGPGEICAVVGPNGAGKSTLFRILTGLTTLTRGEAQVLGVDAGAQPDQIRRLIGFMPAEERSLYLRHTCRENLSFHGRLQGMKGATLRDRVEETLSIVGLADAGDRVGFALSSGMRARLMLARAIFHYPRLLILDEPTAAIDPVGAYQLLETIRGIARERDLAVLISSHRLEEIEALDDNVLLLHRGKAVYWGDLDSFRRAWSKPAVRIAFLDDLSAKRAVAAWEGSSSILVLSAVEHTVTVTTDVSVGELLAYVRDVLPSIVEVEPVRAPLRDLLAAMLNEASDTVSGEGE